MNDLRFKAKFWLCLALAVLAMQIGKSFGLRVEDLQLYIFPVVLVAFALIGSWLSRPPIYALGLVFVLWGFSALNVRGYLPDFSSGVYLAKLSGDSDGAKAELFRQRYRRISKNYELPKLKLLMRELSSKEEALRWLSKDKKESLLIYGDSNWLSVLLPDDFSSFLSKSDIPKQETNPFNSHEQLLAKQLKLKQLEENFLTVYENDFSKNFLLAFGPREFRLPNGDDELAQFYSAWLASAFSKNNEKIAQGALKKSAVRGLSEASELGGAWKSPLPRGVTRFLLGSAEILLGVGGGYFGEARCGVGNLRKSASFVHERESKELLAAILNNAAVGQIMVTKDGAEFREAKAWLWRASNFRNKQGEPVPSAILALFNLIQLERTFSVPF